MKIFSSKSQSIVGVDIGTSAVKCAELTGSLGNARLAAWGIKPLPSGAMVDNMIANEEAVLDALSAALVSSGSKADKAAVSISTSHAITKVITVPADMKEAEIEDQVQLESVHFVPYPIDEVNIDFQVMGPSVVNPDQEVDVLVAASRGEIIDTYTSLIEDAGLVAEIVDIDTFALERLYRFVNPFSHSKKSEVTALFDIGVANTQLVVFDEDKIIYTRVQNFGGKQLVQLIRREYGINNEEAEALVSSDSPPDDMYSNIYLPFYKMAGQELSRALQFFYSSSSHSSTDNVVITGGCSALPDFSEHIGKYFEAKHRVLTPTDNVATMGDKKELNRNIGSLAVALGLSLRGLKS